MYLLLILNYSGTQLLRVLSIRISFEWQWFKKSQQNLFIFPIRFPTRLRILRIRENGQSKPILPAPYVNFNVFLRVLQYFTVLWRCKDTYMSAMIAFCFGRYSGHTQGIPRAEMHIILKKWRQTFVPRADNLKILKTKV